MLPLQAVPLIFISLTQPQAEAWCRKYFGLFPLDWSATYGDRLWCWNAPASLTIPICLGEPWMSGGNDWGMERQRERKGGRMMEWLLNIQQAAKSMQGVVGRLLHYGGASELHLFISLFFPLSILDPQHLSSHLCVAPFQFPSVTFPNCNCFIFFPVYFC